MDLLATEGRTVCAATIGMNVSRASETVQWFLEQQPYSALLLPDNSFGLDITALCIPGGKIICLVLQAKWHAENHLALAMQQEAIASLDLVKFFTKKVCISAIAHSQ